MSYKFLVVDDTNFMRKMAADCLKQYGHVVVGEATNGREAIKQYEELNPDVVMMDLTMPEMNGIDAIKEILKLDPSAIILICSASNQQDMIVDALETGAKGYLMKPFKPDRLNEIIRKYAEPHIISKREAEAKVKEEEVAATTTYQTSEPVYENVNYAPRSYYDDTTTSIYGSDEDQETEVAEETIALEEEEQVEEIVNDFDTNTELEPTLEMTESSPAEEPQEEEEETVTLEEVTEEPMLETEEVFDDEEEQAVGYAEELLAVLGTEQLVESEEEQEVYLELDQADEIEEQEVNERPIVELASKPVSSKTYHFPISRNKLNFVTSYMCNWDEELKGSENNYTFTCSEEDNKVSIEMLNSSNERQKVELSLDSFRQLFTWMEDKFEEGRKHKAVSSK